MTNTQNNHRHRSGGRLQTHPGTSAVLPVRSLRQQSLQHQSAIYALTIIIDNYGAAGEGDTRLDDDGQGQGQDDPDQAAVVGGDWVLLHDEEERHQHAAQDGVGEIRSHRPTSGPLQGAQDQIIIMQIMQELSEHGWEASDECGPKKQQTRKVTI
jgi:hypothetical protein